MRNIRNKIWRRSLKALEKLGFKVRSPNSNGISRKSERMALFRFLKTEN